MTKDEEVLAAILSERGFLVGESTRLYKTGDLVDDLHKVDYYDSLAPVDTAQPFRVIGEATEEEWQEQQKIIRSCGATTSPLRYRGGNLYRLATD